MHWQANAIRSFYLSSFTRPFKTWHSMIHSWHDISVSKDSDSLSLPIICNLIPCWTTLTNATGLQDSGFTDSNSHAKLARKHCLYRKKVQLSCVLMTLQQPHLLIMMWRCTFPCAVEERHAVGSSGISTGGLWGGRWWRWVSAGCSTGNEIALVMRRQGKMALEIASVWTLKLSRREKRSSFCERPRSQEFQRKICALGCLNAPSDQLWKKELEFSHILNGKRGP